MTVNDMTVKELMAKIREMVKTINRRKKGYESAIERGEFDEMNPVFSEEYGRLHERGMSGYKKGELTPSLYTRIDGKRKRRHQFEIQYNELKSFIDNDIFSPEGIELDDEATRKKYESFLRNLKDVDKDTFTPADWRKFIDQFNMIKTETNTYGYEDKGAGEAYVREYMKTPTEKRQFFGKVVQRAYESVKERNESVTYKKILKETRKELKASYKTLKEEFS